MLKKLYYLALFAVMLVVFTNARASVICSYNCSASSTGGSGTELPQLIEVYSVGDTVLNWNVDGVIFLDQVLYDTHPALNIPVETPVYTSVAEASDPLGLPDTLQLLQDYIGLDGTVVAEGNVIADYIFLMDFDDADVLNLGASAIVLVDGAALTAVPLPASFWLMLTGLAGLSVRLRVRSR